MGHMWLRSGNIASYFTDFVPFTSSKTQNYGGAFQNLGDVYPLNRVLIMMLKANQSSGKRIISYPHPASPAKPVGDHTGGVLPGSASSRRCQVLLVWS